MVSQKVSAALALADCNATTPCIASGNAVEYLGRIHGFHRKLSHDAYLSLGSHRFANSCAKDSIAVNIRYGQTGTFAIVLVTLPPTSSAEYAQP